MKIVHLFLLLGIFFLVSCQKVPSEKFCSVDSDCVAASCCHATDAVNKEYAPDCSGEMCTMNCAPETLDCGQGEIKCINSECQVILKR